MRVHKTITVASCTCTRYRTKVCSYSLFSSSTLKIKFMALKLKFD